MHSHSGHSHDLLIGHKFFCTARLKHITCYKSVQFVYNNSKCLQISSQVEKVWNNYLTTCNKQSLVTTC